MNKTIDQWIKATYRHLFYRPNLIDPNEEAVKIENEIKYIHIFKFHKLHDLTFIASLKTHKKRDGNKIKNSVFI